VNLRAKCVNKACPGFEIEKSVMVGQLAGYGAPNDRIICPSCGQRMVTTQSVNVSKGKGVRKIASRTSPRWSAPRRTSKRTIKRTYKRGGGKRS
jgi:hypothetical protein